MRIINTVGEGAVVTFHHQGDFTVALLADEVVGITGVGSAKRHPDDKEDLEFGEALAFARALQDYAVRTEVALRKAGPKR